MDFLVKRDDLRECRSVEGAAPEPGPGEALLRVGAFGLSANNITYGVFGETMSYWDFFPAEQGWGRIPVWGFADVIASEVDGLEQGTRVYGYLPPSTGLVVVPQHVSESGFVDASPHRAALPSAYNGYLRTGADPFYDAGREDVQMLLRPLFYTSFLLDDFLDESSRFGAEAVVLSSASSKTALSAAFLIAQREGIELIGLTSAPRTGFVQGLGLYDSVVAYEEISLLPQQSAVYVDMAGNAAVRDAVHGHYGEALAHDAVVGATHWERAEGGSEELPGPQPNFFFAPDRVRKRVEDWGREELDRRVAAAWHPFAEWAAGWMRIERGSGPDAIEHAYLDLLEGQIDPAVGYVLSPA